MQKTKIIITLILIVALIVFFPILVKAENTTYTATSTINGVEAQWSYELDDSNKIIELICTNSSELTGSITIPSTLSDKTVLGIGKEAFKGNTQITEVIIPSTVEKIGARAFAGCTNLSSVDLGQVREFAGDLVFEKCTSLNNIVIPKTLTQVSYNYVQGPFKGCTNLTNVTFEEGTTTIVAGVLMDAKGVTKVTIPSNVTEIGGYAFANSGLTEITIPNTVGKIGAKAFANCTNLSSVDLGQVREFTGTSVFEKCTSLKSIVIPKTLTQVTYNYINGPFKGCTNLTDVTLEEGITIIAAGLLMDAEGVKEVTIPSSVTEIGGYAFMNSGLEKITIPNKIPKIDTSTFEGTQLVEVEIPESVKQICVDAFKDCTKLTKITIPKTVEKMGYFDTPTDKNDIFANHHEDLTIYCYENSDAAQHAIKNNIKYVYLTEPSIGEDINPEEEEDGEQNGGIPGLNQNPPVVESDNTVATEKIPNAGAEIGLILAIIIISSVCVYIYKKSSKLRDI